MAHLEPNILAGSHIGFNFYYKYVTPQNLFGWHLFEVILGVGQKYFALEVSK